MEPLHLHVYPDPILSRRQPEVKKVDAQLRRQVRAMFDLMYANKGIGLAANQAGLPLKLMVMNLTGDPDKREEEMVFINPKITSASKEMIAEEEGCLSFPEVRVKVQRHAHVSLKATGLEGEDLFFDEVEDLFARCIQHEMDHLAGITFVERLDPEQRALIADRLKAMEEAYRLKSKVS
ncbi:MAG: peptide deformylase [Planctomycetota bacterium]